MLGVITNLTLSYISALKQSIVIKFAKYAPK